MSALKIFNYLDLVPASASTTSTGSATGPPNAKPKIREKHATLVKPVIVLYSDVSLVIA